MLASRPRASWWNAFSSSTSPSTSPADRRLECPTSPSHWRAPPERHPFFSTINRKVTLPGQALVVPHRPQPSRSAFRGAGSVGSPVGRLVPRLTSRPPLLALAPLTAESGVGNRPPIRLMSGHAGRRAPHRASIAGRTRGTRAGHGGLTGPYPSSRAGIEPGSAGSRVGSQSSPSRGSRPRLVTLTSEPGNDRDSRERQWRSSGHRARHDRLPSTCRSAPRTPVDQFHTVALEVRSALARRKTWFREGGRARPKGGASSDARVWTPIVPVGRSRG
jgi:hypothetical protein